MRKNLHGRKTLSLIFFKKEKPSQFDGSQRKEEKIRRKLQVIEYPILRLHCTKGSSAHSFHISEKELKT